MLLPLVLGFILFARANQVTDGKALPAWVQSLLSADVNQQRQAAAGAEAERSQSIRVILEVLKEDRTEANKHKIAAAIKIAGTLRAVEACESLINKIGFQESSERPRFVDRGPSLTPRREDYIALDALVRIGKPSIRPVMKRLTRELTPPHSRLLVAVVQEIGGERLPS